jgi:hypothetical protein
MSKRRTVNKWTEIIESWKESGESQASFCRRNNIALSTFGYHLKRGKKKDSGFTRVSVAATAKKPVKNKSVEIRTDYCTIIIGGENIVTSLPAVLKTLKELAL